MNTTNTTTRSSRRDPALPVRILVLAAIFITPTVFDLGSVKPFDLVKATTVLFFGWLAFGTWLALVIRGRTSPRRFTMAYLAGGFLLANTIATIFSTTKYTSLFGWYGRYNGLVVICVLILVFYVIACVYRERRDRLHEIVYAIAAGSLVMTLYILMQRAHLDPIKWAQPSGGVPGQPYFGTMGNANFAGGYLGLTAPCLYYAFHRFKLTWQRALVGVWALGVVATLWFTSARNGMFGLAAATAMLLFIHRRRVPAILKIGAAAGAVVAIVLATIVIWHPGSNKPPAMFRRVDVLRSKTIKVRAAWWVAGLRMFAHRPVTGWGPDSFVTHYPKYLSRSAAPLGDSETADKPHNVYVEHAAQTGLLGLGAYLALVIVALRRGLRRLRDGPPGEHALGSTLLALLAAYLGQAFFSIDVVAIALIGWVVLGSIAAWADPPTGDDARPPAGRPVPVTGRVLSVVAVLLAAALAALSTAPLKAEHEAKTAGRLAGKVERSEVLGHYALATKWDPFEPLYRGFTGDFLERQASGTKNADIKRDLLAQAVRNYERMNKLQPGYHLWKYSVGKTMGDLAAVGGATFEDAQSWLREARRLAPYDWRIVTAQAELMNTWAINAKDKKRDAPRLLCAGLGYAKDAVKLRRTRGDTQLAYGRTLARLGHLDESVEPLRRAIKHDDTENVATRVLNEVERLQKLPKSKRPPVVRCP